MIRTHRRTRATAAVESSDDSEAHPWSKRLRSTSNQQTVGNEQPRLTLSTTGNSRNKPKKRDSIKRKVPRGRNNILSSTDDENEPSQHLKTTLSGHVSDSGNDEDFGKASGSSFISSKNSTAQRRELKIISGTDSDSSPSSMHVVTSSDELPASYTETVFLRFKQNSLKALSDYETGDSSERGQHSVPYPNDIGQATRSHPPENENMESSSDNDVLKSSNRRRNRPAYLDTTSDSSDGEVVIKSPRFRKRRRIVTSSEDTDSDNLRSGQTSARVRSSWLSGRDQSVEGTSSDSSNLIQRTSRTNTRQIWSGINDRIYPTRVQFRRENNSQRRRRRMRPMSGITSTYTRPRDTILRRRISQDNSMSSASSDVISDNDWDFRSFTIRMEHVNESRRRRYIGPRTLRNRTIPQVMSSATESDGSLPNSNRRRRGALVSILESDDDAANDSRPTINLTRSTHFSPVRAVNSDSDGESEKCSICLTRFGSQEIGSPVSCEHSFCMACIQEWAKNSNTCPIDRKVFNRIMVRSNLEGEVVREVQVQQPITNFWEGDMWTDLAGFVMAMGTIGNISDDDGPEDICCVCRDNDQSDDMIVCDFCNNVYHMTCLNPPLRSIPVDDWSCPSCIEEEFEEFNLLSSSSDSDTDFI